MAPSSAARRSSSTSPGRSGCSAGMPELRGALGNCRAPHGAPATGRPVRLRQDERDVQPRVSGKPSQGVGRPRGRAGEADPGRGHPRSSGRGRSDRIASRRASGVVRSRIRTPSRWSISCWITRDWSPSTSTRSGAPVASCPRDDDRAEALDGHVHLGQREAALVVDGLLVGLLDQHGVDDHAELVVLVCAVHEDAAQQTELRGRETDAMRVLHDPPHPRDERTQIVRELLDLARALAQRRVGIAPDLPERELASRLGAILALLLAAFLPRGLGGGGHTGIVATGDPRRSPPVPPPAEASAPGVRRDRQAPIRHGPAASS